MEAPAPRQAPMETPLHGISSNSHSSYLAPQPAAEGRQGPIEISYSNPLCLLDDVLTPSLVQSFRNQARCRPSLVTSEVITGTARIRIRLALTGDPTQSFVRPEHISDWTSHVTITQASDIICRYFLHTASGPTVPIAEIVSQIKLRYRLSDEGVEDECFIRLEVAINKYMETNPEGNRGTLKELARLIEEKLPKNSQLLADYVHRKGSDLPIEEDTPFFVIQRIKTCLGEIRNLKRRLDRYGPYDQGYEAGATIDSLTPSSDRGKVNAPPLVRDKLGKFHCQCCGIPGHSKG